VAAARIALIRLGYDQGWSFTPLDGKIPTTKRWQQLPRETLETALRWAEAGNIGLRTGPVSGVIVLDVDSTELPASVQQLPPTVIARTGKGGWHFYFTAPSDCPGNRAGIMIDGIKCDVRGRGGQVVYPGSTHPETGQPYTFVPGRAPGDLPLADWPAELLSPDAPPPSRPPPPPSSSGRTDAYASQAVSRECAAVASAAEGTRNHTLNAAAFSLGQLVGGDVVDEATVTADLMDAARRCGLSDAEARQTIASGLAAGRAKPRGVPEPPTSAATPAVTSDTVKGDSVETTDTGVTILHPKRHQPTAKRFIESLYTRDGSCQLVYFQGELWSYDSICYQLVRRERVERDMLEFLTNAYFRVRRGKAVFLEPFPATVSATESAVDAVQLISQLALRPNDIPPFWIDGRLTPDPKQLIRAPNMCIDMQTWKSHPLTPQLFSTTALDFNLDLDPPEPKEWFKFLHVTFPHVDSQRLLQQFMGYCLSGFTHYQKMLFLIGPPRSGKGVISAILRKLVGWHHVANITTSGLASQFGLSGLIGNPLAIISDARFSGHDVQGAIERLLNIVGEDPIQIDRKHRDPINIKLPTRFVIVSNELPCLPDSSRAISARALVLQTHKSHLGCEDLGLLDRLYKELPGILHWAVAGLHDLLSSGRFVVPESTKSLIEELGRLTSPISAFIEDRCVIDPAATCTAEELFAAWRDWCAQENRPPLTRQLFGRQLLAAVPNIEVAKNGFDQRMYRGIALR
jgi:putative DNA primase/helicase